MLIDSGPVSELIDSALLVPRVGGVVFFLRAGRSPAPHTLNSLPEMRRTNGNVVGLTLTFVPGERIAVPDSGKARQVQTQRQLQAGPA